MPPIKNILIPNGTSIRNLGDEAILQGMLTILQKMSDDFRITFHCSDPQLRSQDQFVAVRSTLYHWAVFEKKDVITRLSRLFRLFGYVALLSLGRQFDFSKRPNQLRQLLRDFFACDVIILAGGGYLRSKPGITQSLNLLMLLAIIYVAKLSCKPVLVAPISFGPFAHKWQKRLSAKALKNLVAVQLRESHSAKLLQRYLVQFSQSHDLAFMLSKHAVPDSTIGQSQSIGFTVIEWLQKEQQAKLEEGIAAALTAFTQGKPFIIQPIIQVHAPEYGAKDLAVTKRVVEILQKNNVNVQPIIKLENLAHAKQVYGGLRILLGTRMHSTIIAATQSTPFVALAYEHKTQGVTEDLGVGNLCIDCRTANKQNLLSALIEVESHYAEYKQMLEKSIANFQKQMLAEWKKIFPPGKNIVEKEKTEPGYIPRVTVAASALNEEQNVVPWLASILKQEQRGFILEKILLISDGSSDSTVAAAKTVSADILEIIEYPDRVGKSSRLNEIYNRLESDVLVQTDADVIFDHPLVIHDLIKPMLTDATVAMIGGNIHPMRGQTFNERAVNCTVDIYLDLRALLREGRNIHTANGGLLAYRKEFVKQMTIPVDMIANDAYTFFTCLTSGYGYRFVGSAKVTYRSPQTLRDQIRQNVRFESVPKRMARYFSPDLVAYEFAFPKRLFMWKRLGKALRHPILCGYIFCVNTYCRHQARKNEGRLTAQWAMAYSTKNLTAPKDK